MKINYGDSSIDIVIPGEAFAGFIEPAGAIGMSGGSDCLTRALARQHGRGPLSRFAAPGEPVLVLVNDATRPTPTAVILEALREQLSTWQSSFLVATGTHRAPTGTEMQQIFGGLWDQVRQRVSVHDAGDATALADIGRTTRGTAVAVNRQVAEAARIMVIGSVEPHYFAGYTGGRKMFLPGTASAATIAENHRLAMDPEARALRLAGNPVHEDMDEVLDMLGGSDIFAVQVVLDKNRDIVAAHAGDIRIAFKEAAAVTERVAAAPLPARSKIVLAVAAPPHDADLYQAQKAIENGLMALAEDGILILVSACRNGVGSRAFLEIMQGAATPAEVIKGVEADYRFGSHKAARLAAAAGRAEIWAVTGIDDETVASAFMRPFPDVQAAVDAALRDRPGGRVSILPDAGATVPLCIED